MPNRRPNVHLMRPILALLLVGGLASVLAGCGGTTVPPAPKLDACTMVDAATAAEILGEPVTAKPIESAAASKNGISLCNYQTATLNNGFMVTVGRHGLSDVKTDAAGEMEQNVKSSEEALPDIKVTLTKLPGLGDAAFLLTTDIYIQVYVYKGPERVMINRNVAPTPAAIAATEKLARLALASLP